MTRVAAPDPQQNHGMPTSMKRFLILALVGLSLLASAYFAKGMYLMVLDGRTNPPWPCDMHLRWQEQHYVLRHKNFYDVLNRVRDSDLVDESDRNLAAGVERDLGVPREPGYPPWAYLTGVLFLWPSHWQAARYYYAIVNVFAMAAIAWWIFSRFRHHGTLVASVTATAFCAFGSVCHTLGNGQYGILVLASLVGVYELESRRRWLPSGLLLGIAMVKPTLTIPFVLPLLFKLRLATLFTAGSYLLVASVFTWLMCGTDPLTMLQQMSAETAEWGKHTGTDLIAVLYKLGINVDAAANLAAASTGAVLLGATLRFRKGPLLKLFAIAAIVARLWTYHRPYDDLILLFPLVYLGSQWLENKKGFVGLCVLMLGCTLVAPARAYVFWPMKIFGISIWIISLIMIVLVSQTEAPEDQSQQPLGRDT